MYLNELKCIEQLILITMQQAYELSRSQANYKLKIASEKSAC